MSAEQQVGPELVERMVALVRGLSSSIAYSIGRETYFINRSFIDEASAIVAELPAPIDPDLIEAREIVARHHEGRDVAGMAQFARSGIMDAGSTVTCTLAALKRAKEQPNAR